MEEEAKTPQGKKTARSGHMAENCRGRQQNEEGCTGRAEGGTGSWNIVILARCFRLCPPTANQHMHPSPPGNVLKQHAQGKANRMVVPTNVRERIHTSRWRPRPRRMSDKKDAGDVDASA